MEVGTSNQLYIFIVFILTGILIGILFDIFRILRRSFKTSDFLTNIEDILFWILTGFILIYTIFKFNNGQIRLFIIVAILIGVLLYMLLFSKIFIKTNLIIVNFIKKIFNKITLPFKLLLKFLRKIFFKPISFIFINFRNFSTLLLKKQKSIIKNGKKRLNKPKNKRLKEGF